LAIPKLARLSRAVLFYAATFVLVTVGAIWLAFRVTPLQTVNAAGQSAQIGAAASMSLSGPGELDLFGQAMPTKPHFSGPIRPRLQLNHITINQQVVQTLKADGTRKIELSLSQQLAGGWMRYFEYETLIVAGFALVGLVAIVGVVRRHSVTRKVVLLTAVAGTAFAVVANVGGVLLTASSTPKVLSSVKTLDDLVSVDPLASAPSQQARPLPGVQAVVIGDSTASGDGLPLARNASALDRACSRSPESYANDLSAVNGWNVLNLSCSSATITNGLLNMQVLNNGSTAPVQFLEAEQATHAKLVIVSIGADDVQWSIMTRLCVASTVCNDKVSTAYFTQLLDSFTGSYYQLLGHLASLANHPAVLINEYYAPFGSNVSCLSKYQMTPAKAKVLMSRLGQLNTVLARGAHTFGFGVVQPRFTGHELCTADSYVQGPSDPAPLHPTAAGELAIALADQQALPDLVPAPAVSPSVSASPTSAVALGSSRTAGASSSGSR
jgi:GDSL-like Lipase/Acylhydrolase family